MLWQHRKHWLRYLNYQRKYHTHSDSELSFTSQAATANAIIFNEEVGLGAI